MKVYQFSSEKVISERQYLKESECYSEEQLANYTKAADMAEVIFGAATDGKS